MKEQIKQSAPYAGSVIRNLVVAVVTLLGTFDIVPESKIEPLTASLTVIAVMAWSMYAKHKALIADPPTKEVK